MYRAVHSAAAQQCGIGGVDHSVDALLCDVPADDGYSFATTRRLRLRSRRDGTISSACVHSGRTSLLTCGRIRRGMARILLSRQNPSRSAVKRADTVALMAPDPLPDCVFRGVEHARSLILRHPSRNAEGEGRHPSKCHET
jgi:hypothetical protein